MASDPNDVFTMTQWIQYVEIPVIGGIIAWAFRHRASAEAEREKAREREAALRERIAQVELALSEYKLQAAKDFASVGYLQDVERRLATVLQRLEDKVDVIVERQMGNR